MTKTFVSSCMRKNRFIGFTLFRGGGLWTWNKSVKFCWKWWIQSLQDLRLWIWTGLIDLKVVGGWVALVILLSTKVQMFGFLDLRLLIWTLVLTIFLQYKMYYINFKEIELHIRCNRRCYPSLPGLFICLHQLQLNKEKFLMEKI